MNEALDTGKPGLGRAAILLEKDRELISPAYAFYSDLIVESAEGS